MKAPYGQYSRRMCPGFVKLKLPRNEAVDRVRAWLCRREIMAPTPVKPAEVSRIATDSQGRWRGLTIMIYQHNDWTIFEDLSGGLCSLGHRDASIWLGLAAETELVEGEYNDALAFASMVVVKSGTVTFDFFDDSSAPSLHRNRGNPPVGAPVTRIEVASVIDDDDAWVNSPGMLWLLEANAE